MSSAIRRQARRANRRCTARPNTLTRAGSRIGDVHGLGDGMDAELHRPLSSHFQTS